MRSVPGGATGGGIGAGARGGRPPVLRGGVGGRAGGGARAAARFALGAALGPAAVFFLTAIFLPAVFLRTAALGTEVFFFFALVSAFFLVAMGSTSTLKTATVQENDASFVKETLIY